MATTPLQPTAHIPTGVLRSGENAPHANLQTLKDPAAKTYHHMTPGARFIMPDGLAVQFLGGQFVTADPAIIAELDKIVDKPTSMIFTKKASQQAIVDSLAAAAKDAAEQSDSKSPL